MHIYPFEIGSCQREREALVSAIDQYKSIHGTYPRTLEELGSPIPSVLRSITYHPSLQDHEFTDKNGVTSYCLMWFDGLFLFPIPHDRFWVYNSCTGTWRSQRMPVS